MKFHTIYPFFISIHYNFFLLFVTTYRVVPHAVMEVVEKVNVANTIITCTIAKVTNIIRDVDQQYVNRNDVLLRCHSLLLPPTMKLTQQTFTRLTQHVTGKAQIVVMHPQFVSLSSILRYKFSYSHPKKLKIN